MKYLRNEEFKYLRDEEYKYLAGGYEAYIFNTNLKIGNDIYKSIWITEKGIILYKINKDLLLKYEESELLGDLEYYIIENLDDLMEIENKKFKNEIKEILYVKRNRRTGKQYMNSFLNK